MGLEVTIDDMDLSNRSHDTVKSSLLGLLLVSQRSSKLVVPNLPLRNREIFLGVAAAD